MREYTESERHAIDAAYSKMGRGETVTPEEMQMIIAFERERPPTKPWQACRPSRSSAKAKRV